MNFTEGQLAIMREAMEQKKEFIRKNKLVRASIRAVMMADCEVVIRAIDEEVERLGARPEPDHQSG